MRSRAPLLVLFAVRFYTNQHAFAINTSELTALDFGTLLFNFTASSGGTVAAEYSAEGKLSVGMNGSCFDP